MARKLDHVPSLGELQAIWSQLSLTDKALFLGHTEKNLSLEDSAKLMEIVTGNLTAKTNRDGRNNRSRSHRRS